MAPNKIMRQFGGCVIAWAMLSAAHAADAPDSWTPPPAFTKSEPRPIEMLSGWYLRGDVGYRMNRVDSVETSSAIVSETYGNSASVGLGAGYKYHWFRTDVTVDYGARANYRGTTAAVTPQPHYAAKIDSLTVLANAYIDMGTWAGFTPYIGAGAGASFLRATNHADTTLPVGEIVTTGEKLNASWAAMAGVSFQIMPTWLIDVGYRYVSLGDARSAIDSTGNITRWQNLSAQEIRIGFRMLLD